MATTILTSDVLKKQNAETTNAIIDAFQDNERFLLLSKSEGDLTRSRDEEDDNKLQKGIDYAKNKGVLDPNYVPQPYKEIDVLGKTPNQVADEILNDIFKKDNDQESSSVIVLCGLSGTGKGTTVSQLRKRMEEDHGKKVVTWSNGNIFRSVTLLAKTWSEQNSAGLDDALSKENLESFMNMLEFGTFKDKFDTRINGLGYDMLVSEVQNTELKSTKVSKNIPTVAEVTQGEVIQFAANAITTMGSDKDVMVLLEGREQTVNYVRTPHRFTLTLSDETLIGKRRAAQRVMASVEDSDKDNIMAAVETTLEKLTKDL
eukprot:CAMPEP_0194133374 /NCGR_PEP_ID=MMETSP0152-20130528/3577_1 /TAXON_ID=1049557 /ORGANISM="Thalassiothrix antarctica, Strain L6-D1" /LENGTH=315 /DNA_ID=CAMNT_0038828683 /DNA_START=115 /DNA_END=1062 /DNA_ORIENTATION=-